MVNSDPFVNVVLQFGGLGLAGYVLWWLTQRMNGKVDRLADSINNCADAVRENSRLTKDLVGEMRKDRVGR